MSAPLVTGGIRRRPDRVLGQHFAPKAKVCTVCKAEFTGGMPLALWLAGPTS